MKTIIDYLSDAALAVCFLVLVLVYGAAKEDEQEETYE